MHPNKDIHHLFIVPEKHHKTVLFSCHDGCLSTAPLLHTLRNCGRWTSLMTLSLGNKDSVETRTGSEENLNSSTKILHDLTFISSRLGREPAKVVAKTVDSSGRELVIYQKPTSESCYNNLFVLKRNYAPLRQCISKLPSGGVQKWPELWHKQLVSVKPQSVSADTKTSKKDTKKWSEIVSDVYLERCCKLV
ncbi:hypothetical protein DY000_02020037 [Brassica cretica]|uniref:Uncharacterized protein n=1 Tax=Brassica cretica TaxID=69181 RepID=A0ABQ7EGK1_BRACR|nr:hypothetical protein DY000_02020037 [Brassica cretica]